MAWPDVTVQVAALPLAADVDEPELLVSTSAVDCAYYGDSAVFVLLYMRTTGHQRCKLGAPSQESHQLNQLTHCHRNSHCNTRKPNGRAAALCCFGHSSVTSINTVCALSVASPSKMFRFCACFAGNVFFVQATVRWRGAGARSIGLDLEVIGGFHPLAGTSVIDFFLRQVDEGDSKPMTDLKKP